MVEKLPVKLFYRIGEVSQLLQVESHTLRYWEQQFSVVRPRKSANGHRVYRRVDVERLQVLRDLLYRQGYTIAGVKKRIKQEGVQLFQSVKGTPVSQSSSRAAAEEVTPQMAQIEQCDLAEAQPSTLDQSPKTLQLAPELLAQLKALREQIQNDLDMLCEEQAVEAQA